MFDLHRHSEFSTFDGFGKAEDLAKLAASYGYSALGISDHGNVNGLVQHYYACKKAGIKPILGCEVYYQPKFDPDARTYHLCLFAKNAQGYKNLNRILTVANKRQFFMTARVTDDLLARYHNGLICTTACVASIFSQRIIAGDVDAAYEYLCKFRKIFGADLYIEIQPYVIDAQGTQELVNSAFLELSETLKIPCILTSDSHYGTKEEFSTYKKMHEIAQHTRIDIEATYRERYMPLLHDLETRFEASCKGLKRVNGAAWVKRMLEAMKRLEDSVDGDILESFGSMNVTYMEGVDAYQRLVKNVKIGMKERGCISAEYVRRVKQELEVIKENDFSDYFLIVQDYVQYAKRNGIRVGPGRGSGCNSIVSYFLGITDVDSLYFNLDYRRFLRKEKKKFPDIDLDFETDKRQQVIDYLLEKYTGKSAQICSYGLYKVDNLLNDLFKVCKVESKAEQKELKVFIHSFVGDDEMFAFDSCMKNKQARRYNEDYDDIIVHFSRLYRKVRYIGTHAAGVAIVSKDISRFAAVEKRGGKLSCVYDMADLEKIGVLKVDILGVKTISEIAELEVYTGKKFDYSWLNDKAVYREFRRGNTDGIFQFERGSVKDMLRDIHCDCFDDLIAANAMNRPAPIQLGMPEIYAENKKNIEKAKTMLYYTQAQETYGTVIYQEQIMRICHEIGNLSLDDADKMMKMIKGVESRAAFLRGENPECERIRKAFIAGAKSNGFDKKVAAETFNSILVYSFNKGHATGYAMIAAILMYYKIYHPEFFWYVKLKYAKKEDLQKYKALAVKTGCFVLLPHVNGSAEYSVSERFGSVCLQEGLSAIDYVGVKAAKVIQAERELHGDYTSFYDFRSRLPRRVVTSRVLNALENAGALEFNEKRYLARAEKYNSAIYGRGVEQRAKHR